MLIGIAGPAGSGKDTAARYLVECRGFRKDSFASPLKAGLSAMLSIDPILFEDNKFKESMIEDLGCTSRHLLQTLGTDWGREIIHKDIWVILKKREYQSNHKGLVVFSDVRFENEAEFIRSNGFIIHIKGRDTYLDEDASKHQSEDGIEIKPNDQILDNSGTLRQLEKRLDKILKKSLYCFGV